MFKRTQTEKNKVVELWEAKFLGKKVIAKKWTDGHWSIVEDKKEWGEDINNIQLIKKI